jgi:FKBP-type peptidyl-prolyl cis-trans isomerase FkpA
MPTRLSRRSALLAALGATLLLSCERASPVAANPDPKQNQYAASLGVNLDTMRLQPTGLYTGDAKVGTGAEATPGAQVKVHYTGWLPGGQKFDSSRDRNEPFEFVLGAGEVIQGWDQGVAGMRVGGRRTLVIPPHMGYGARGTGPIPANAVLVFDVELLDVRR